MAQKTGFGGGVLVGIALSVIALVIATLIIVYTGAYNVSAKVDHSSVGRWALDTTMISSVQRQAPETSPQLTDAMVSAGAGEYQAMCEHCHGAPGKEAAEWTQGMLPEPPHLTEAASHWTPAEIYWLVNNGVKMSAMPAFGPTHSDEALWNITAFVTKLPGMTPAKYEELTGQHSHNH